MLFNLLLLLCVKVITASNSKLLRYEDVKDEPSLLWPHFLQFDNVSFPDSSEYFSVLYLTTSTNVTMTREKCQNLCRFQLICSAYVFDPNGTCIHYSSLGFSEETRIRKIKLNSTAGINFIPVTHLIERIAIEHSSEIVNLYHISNISDEEECRVLCYSDELCDVYDYVPMPEQMCHIQSWKKSGGNSNIVGGVKVALKTGKQEVRMHNEQ